MGKIPEALGVKPWEIAEGFNPSIWYHDLEKDKPIPIIIGSFPLYLGFRPDFFHQALIFIRPGMPKNGLRCGRHMQR